MNTTTKLLVVAVVVGGVAFFGGLKYGESASAKNLQANAGANFRNGAGRGVNMMAGANGGFTTGDIISKDAQSVTIKMRDGSSRIILYSSSTEVSKFDAGTMNDLVVGKTVSVTGTSNTDGSVTAKTIQIRPLMSSPSPSPAK